MASTAIEPPIPYTSDNTHHQHDNTSDARNAHIRDPDVDRESTHGDHEEDELPSYNQVDPLPTYISRHLHPPVIAYQMFQTDRKVRTLLPTGPSLSCPVRRASTYILRSRTGPSLFASFSKKPDMVLSSAGEAKGGREAGGKGQETGIAQIRFDQNGPLPWYPRATVFHNSGSGEGPKVYPLGARDFISWRYHINGGSTGPSYLWTLATRPISLVLVEEASESIVARFTYSAEGTRALRGAEVGELCVYGGQRSTDKEVVEMIICSCAVTITQLERMGRWYRNCDGDEGGRREDWVV
ncbi:hypothetical protein K402DRAFT_416577 [Aulographum hederae CBS 113979]|uniref:Uncharacterized protein n=1 Tax=Aulographum hederae CBS 113979 TaxID=1176131 RepID=A0A6G1HGA4_9PEZI|nr:hypothetical protein K402DRAFT_416577 [Aulographum hederae CBS 113979]